MDLMVAAKILYDRWCQAHKGRDASGQLLPCWEALDGTQRATWTGVAETACLIDPPALAAPVSGAAMADAASEPGYRAPELREQAAQSAPLRAALHAAVAHKDIYAEGMLGEVVDLLAADLQRLLGESLAGLLAAARSLEATRIDWDRRNIPADLGAWWAGKVRAKVAAPADKPAPQAAQAAPRPARPSPRTARCIGCRGTGQKIPAPQSHARVCPDYTQEDEAWCLTKYWADNRGTMISYEEALESVRRDSKHARYTPPSKDGERAALQERRPGPAVRAALKLIDPGSVRIAMDRDQLTVSGPLTAEAKRDPEAAFRAIPDLRPAAPRDLPADACSCEVSRQVHDHACPAYGPVPRPLVAAPDRAAPAP